MGRHSGSHHSSSGHHSGSHHSSSSHHSGGHHRSGSSGGHSTHYNHTRTSHYRYRSSAGYYSNESIPANARKYNGTWYDANNYNGYDINMDDPYVIEHYDPTKTSKLFKLIKKNPIWLIACFYAFFFSIPMVFGICSSNVLYELVIPLFENADMTDLAFTIFDNGLYYIQFVPAWLWTIGAPVLTIRGIKKSREYECNFAKEVVDYYEKQAKLEEIEYYAVCPSCGASAGDGEKKVKFCPYCGQNLRVDGLQ